MPTSSFSAAGAHVSRPPRLFHINNKNVEYLKSAARRLPAGGDYHALSRKSNADGQVILTSAELPTNSYSIIVARKDKDGVAGARIALRIWSFSAP